MNGGPEPIGPVIAVVGAGMAGLSAAWELTRSRDGAAAPRVVVVEAGGRVGGKVRSAEFCGRTVDVAADAFLARRPEATELCEELGITGALVAPGASGASLWARDRLRMMPDGLSLGVPTRWWPLARSGILSPAGALRAAIDLIAPHRSDPGNMADRSVAQIVEARLGREVVERLVDPLVGGINAGGVDHLSAEATFPPLLAADRRSGSLMRVLGRPPSPGQTPPDSPVGPGTTPTPVFWSLDGGAARLPAELAAGLAAQGVAVHTGVAVESLMRQSDDGSAPAWRLTLAGDAGAVPGTIGSSDTVRTLDVDGVVLAVPAGQAAGLLGSHAPLASSLLGAIEHASVAVVTISLPSGAIRGQLTGTGFLVPRSSPIGGRPALITGCTYLSAKWPALGRPDDELIRLSVGRHGDTRPDTLDDDELAAAAFAELCAVLDVTGSPRASMVTRWDGAFPQYTVGHLARTAAIEQAVAALPGMAVAGNAYRGVGIPAVVGSGRAAARAVLRSLDGIVSVRPGR